MVKFGLIKIKLYPPLHLYGCITIVFDKHIAASFNDLFNQGCKTLLLKLKWTHNLIIIASVLYNLNKKQLGLKKKVGRFNVISPVFKRSFVSACLNIILSITK